MGPFSSLTGVSGDFSALTWGGVSRLSVVVVVIVAVFGPGPGVGLSEAFTELGLLLSCSTLLLSVVVFVFGAFCGPFVIGGFLTSDSSSDSDEDSPEELPESLLSEESDDSKTQSIVFSEK